MKKPGIQDSKMIHELLEQKYRQYNQASFIDPDPISIPHLFTKKEDIEIAGFFAATIAWGNRKSILANAHKLMDWMDHQPHAFITCHNARDLAPFKKFVHRTFNGTDCIYFIKALRNIYLQNGGLEKCFDPPAMTAENNLQAMIINFREIFFSYRPPARTGKHVSNPAQKSTAKRLCMFLRWMVRKDNCGVDFGIWNSLSPSELCLPLDVHTGNVSRALGLLTRKQNDWQAVEEVTANLRSFDAKDPVKYDFALFGMGVNKDLD